MTLCVLFFFFKQKTAYEMRISDWSSDVCSSDLNLFRALAEQVAAQLTAHDALDTHLRDELGLTSEMAARPVQAAAASAASFAVGAALPLAKIGRASCRERVCQYV